MGSPPVTGGSTTLSAIDAWRRAAVDDLLMYDIGRSGVEYEIQSSRLAEFGGRGMSFNICRGALGSLAMFTAMRNASWLDKRFIDISSCGSSSK
jgi:hypothetical protein